MNKTELRCYCKNVRSALPDISQALLENFVNCEAFCDFDTALCYYPIKSEANILPIANRILSQGKKLAFPRCISQTQIEFYYVNSLEGLFVGSFGIHEPSTDYARVTAEHLSACKALALLPGLAYDREGYRLGYGAGYYDRYLAKINITKVGVGFEGLIFPEIPHTEQDIKMNYLLTEKGVIATNEI